MRQIMCLNQVWAKKAQNEKKKKNVTKDGLNTWSTHPSHSAEEAFLAEKGSVWSTFFGLKTR